jgi:hypothetical protein
MCNKYPAGIFTANAKGPLWMRSNFHKRRVNGNDQGIHVEMLEDKAQNLLVMTRRFLLTAFVITAIALFANTAQAATFTEDFEADFPTWESNWLGLNSDLNNYYCGGARGCERRDNNPDGLYVNTNLLAYDISDNLIFNSAVLLTGGATSDPGIYSNYTITSNNGISRFVFDSAIARGNTSIDNVIAVTSVAAPVPEPEIYAMLGAGLGLMGWVARRRKQRTV